MREQVVAHKKCLVVKGNTMKIKETLKSSGGKWNKPLGGWIFGQGKKDMLFALLRNCCETGAI